MDETATPGSTLSFSNAQPFFGIVENTVDALRLVQAARQGIIPRIVRRLNDSERRQMIESGAVFVFSAEESSIKRWTDSLLWSPSRILGNFLVYREMHERSGGRTWQKKLYALEEPLSRRAPPVQWGTQQKSGHQYEESSGLTAATTTNGLKVNGLIKKTITVTIDGSDLHLISYYTQDDVQSRRLKGLSSRPDITTLELQPHLFRFSNFRNPPKVVIGRDGSQTIVCESEQLESLTEELPDPTNYYSELPDGIGEDRNSSSWTAPSHGSNTASASDHLHRDEWQSQLDPAHMLAGEVRREVYWPSDSPSGVQYNHGHAARSYHLDGTYAQHESQSWPALSSARYDLPPSMSYLQGSVAREADTDTAPSGQMVERRSEESSSYGSQGHYIHTREVGDHHPNTWLSANLRETSQLPGDPNSSSSPRSPSSSNHSHHFSIMHPQENTVDMSSNRDDSESYSVHLQYPQPEFYTGATQISSGNVYSSGVPMSSAAGGESFTAEEKYYGQ